jgi:hypothetical protein
MELSQRLQRRVGQRNDGKGDVETTEDGHKSEDIESY